MKYGHAKTLRALIVKASAHLSDEEALCGIELFDEWKTEMDYTVGDRVRSEEILYKCLQNHTSQENWIPKYSPSLWVRVDDPSVEYPEWRQPTGATDAYPLGAKVSHLGKHWHSIVDVNIWEPSVYGWEEDV